MGWSTSAAYELTIHTTACPCSTLRVMTVVAALFVPVVLLYQARSYRVFRHRLSLPKVGGEDTTVTPKAPVET
jgi:cytochrome bd ubiquinol oxidase subunit II